MVQTTNIRRILDRVMRHPMMRDIPFETAVEYTVDFISLIGAPAIYCEKTAIIPVHDWRGPLPCDYEHMIQVRAAGKGPGRTYRYSGHSFHMSNDKAPFGDLTYKLQGLVIFTSTKDMPVEIAYRAFATDEEGYPLLPDNTSFLRGLEWYIKLQWFTIKYDMGEISQQVMANTQQEYAWAVGDAMNEFGRLNLDQAETLFNSFKMLLPRNNEHWREFFTNGSKEPIHDYQHIYTGPKPGSPVGVPAKPAPSTGSPQYVPFTKEEIDELFDQYADGKTPLDSGGTTDDDDEYQPFTNDEIDELFDNHI